jgi:glyoxylase-like metal-dependent hydrolase (beta-lactamase superfamily II)
VVSPPDGSMGDYMNSLQKLAKRTEPIYFPGHGPVVRNAPRFVAAYILHRKARETSILNQLAKGETDIPSVVGAIYANLDPRLVKAAGMSVLAHLEDLVARGQAATNGPPSIEGRYRLA